MFGIQAARLFDGVNPSPLLRPVVLLEGGRVVSVQRQGGSLPTAQVTQFPGATLLPGLVDAHVHLIFRGTRDPIGDLAGMTDHKARTWMRIAAKTSLEAGVTTIRDLGDRNYLALRLRTELSRDLGAGPEVLASGPPMTVPHGHCWFLGGEADGEGNLQRAVRERADRGVDVIKVMASGGEMTPGSRSWEPQYTVAELRAAVLEAQRSGIPLTAHAHSVEGIRRAVAAGVRMIEHCTFLTADGVIPDARLIEAIVDAGVVVSITVGFDPSGPELSPAAAERMRGVLLGALRLRDAGGTLVCGSDAGVSKHKPHGVLPYSVGAMVSAGFTPLEALRSVTSVAAEACGVGNRKGRVAPGYDADLLAVDEDPLQNIHALHRVVAVYRAGRRVR